MRQALPRVLIVSIAGLLTVPFLWPLHTAPLPSFYSEMLAAVILLIASVSCVVLVWHERIPLLIPKVVLPFIVLIALIAIQLNLGMLAYTYNALVPIFVLLLAIVAAILGASSARILGLKPLLTQISITIIVGGILMFCIQLVQLYRLEGIFSPLIAQSFTSRTVYDANVSQPNHLATYLAWTLICILYLYSKRFFGAGVAFLLVGIILVALTLTGSRMSWLQVVWISVASGYIFWRSEVASRPKYWYAIFLLPLYYLMINVALPYVGQIANFSVDYSPVNRLQSETLDLGRRVLYIQAWDIFLRNPLLGIGVGEFGFNQFRFLDIHDQTLISTSAHNLILDLLVTFGLAGTLLIAGFLAHWYWYVRKGTNNDKLEKLTILLILAVFGIHAMLEFPQSYGYFLWPIAFFMGCLDTRIARIKDNFLFKYGAPTVIAAGLTWCVFLYKDYSQIERLHARFNASMEGESTQNKIARHIDLFNAYSGNFFSAHAEEMVIAALPMDDSDLEAKINMSNRVMRINLSPGVVFRHIAWLSIAGNQDEAAVYLNRLIKLHPKHLPEIASDLERLSSENPQAVDKLLRIMEQNNIAEH